MTNAAEISEIPNDPVSIGLTHPIIYIMIPRELRAAVTSLWRLDIELASILQKVEDPHLQLMRLVWWRDRLEAMAAGEKAPAHPILQAIGQAYAGRDDMAGVEQIADIWADFVEQPVLEEGGTADFAEQRGQWLFTRSAALLGGHAVAGLEEHGRMWGLSDVASHLSDRKIAQSLFERSFAASTPTGRGLPKSLKAAFKLAQMRAKSGGHPHPLKEQAALLRISLFNA